MPLPLPLLLAVREATDAAPGGVAAAGAERVERTD